MDAQRRSKTKAAKLTLLRGRLRLHGLLWLGNLRLSGLLGGRWLRGLARGRLRLGDLLGLRGLGLHGTWSLLIEWRERERVGD